MRALDIYKQDQSPDISGILFLSLNFFFFCFSLQATAGAIRFVSLLLREMRVVGETIFVIEQLTAELTGLTIGL